MTLWGGRFERATDETMRQFNDSITFDRQMYAADIRGSQAYARALAEAGLLSERERDDLIDGLAQVKAEFEAGEFKIQPGDEDIHTAVERRLGELVGEVAGKLHTGRSRNDQVATDLRLHLLGEIETLRAGLLSLQAAIVEKSEAEMDAILPGYTHLQQAQPILFGHWLMAFFWKFDRDRERLADLQKRVSACPLGSGALAGNPFPIDREALAADLGFERVCENSIDAVNDRDFVVECLSWAALTQVHLSNLAEDLIIYASREFGFVEIDSAYATGSSLMPQKKNPDSMELIRGKSGRVIGHLTGTLTTLKGLPSAYNKDLQEDKEALFDVIDTLKMELSIAAGVVATLGVNRERMEAALSMAMLATDLADYLVKRGVPFRQSHHLVGQAVRRAEQDEIPLNELALEAYRSIHPAFEEDVYQVFDLRRSVAARASRGGTAPQSVETQLGRAKEILDEVKVKVKAKVKTKAKVKAEGENQG